MAFGFTDGVVCAGHGGVVGWAVEIFADRWPVDRQGIFETSLPLTACGLAAGARLQFGIIVVILVAIFTRDGKDQQRKRSKTHRGDGPQMKKGAELLRIHEACPYGIALELVLRYSSYLCEYSDILRSALIA